VLPHIAHLAYLYKNRLEKYMNTYLEIALLLAHNLLMDLRESLYMGLSARLAEQNHFLIPAFSGPNIGKIQKGLPGTGPRCKMKGHRATHQCLMWYGDAIIRIQESHSNIPCTLTFHLVLACRTLMPSPDQAQREENFLLWPQTLCSAL